MVRNHAIIKMEINFIRKIVLRTFKKALTDERCLMSTLNVLYIVLVNHYITN